MRELNTGFSEFNTVSIKVPIQVSSKYKLACHFPGQISCRLCKVGEYSEPGMGYCMGCVPGSFSNIEGSSSCKACLRGWFQPFHGM